MKRSFSKDDVKKTRFTLSTQTRLYFLCVLCAVGKHWDFTSGMPNWRHFLKLSTYYTQPHYIQTILLMTIIPKDFFLWCHSRYSRPHILKHGRSNRVTWSPNNTPLFPNFHKGCNASFHLFNRMCRRHLHSDTRLTWNVNADLN